MHANNKTYQYLINKSVNTKIFLSPGWRDDKKRKALRFLIKEGYYKRIGTYMYQRI